ncbi:MULTISPECIES: hypothetical protein [Sphingopyxis]|jgi:hypothetical protein|uniref:hypothetical protein n=1 Tax=Sphingopyxis TaxID=165697 RepID=UPI001A28BBF5|nr:MULTISPECIES: hypothetical protein [Sphingopyxis]MBJ7498223.1 hypothetical protein [Sphingopyxis sp.]HMO73922.1 hypothetical protein [Sphingopyxis sp.]HMP43475.1 hypothetical protein [Sphingopyxis sp.]
MTSPTAFPDSATEDAALAKAKEIAASRPRGDSSREPVAHDPSHTAGFAKDVARQSEPAESAKTARSILREMLGRREPLTESQMAAAEAANFGSRLLMPMFKDPLERARSSAFAYTKATERIHHICDGHNRMLGTSEALRHVCDGQHSASSALLERAREVAEACSAATSIKGMTLWSTSLQAPPEMVSLLARCNASNPRLPLLRQAETHGVSGYRYLCKPPLPSDETAAPVGSDVDNSSPASDGSKPAELRKSVFAEREQSWNDFRETALNAVDPAAIGVQARMGAPRVWSIYYLSNFLNRQVAVNQTTRSALRKPAPPLKSFGMIQRMGLDLRLTERLFDNVLARISKMGDRSAETIEAFVRDIFEQVALVIGQHRLVRAVARPDGRNTFERIRIFDIHTGVSPPLALDRQALCRASINQVPGVNEYGYPRPAPCAHLYHRRVSRTAFAGRPERAPPYAPADGRRQLVRHRRLHQGRPFEGRPVRRAGSWPVGDQFRMGRRA